LKELLKKFKVSNPDSLISFMLTKLSNDNGITISTNRFRMFCGIAIIQHPEYECTRTLFGHLDEQGKLDRIVKRISTDDGQNIKMRSFKKVLKKIKCRDVNGLSIFLLNELFGTEMDTYSVEKFRKWVEVTRSATRSSATRTNTVHVAPSTPSAPLAPSTPLASSAPSAPTSPKVAYRLDYSSTFQAKERRTSLVSIPGLRGNNKNTTLPTRIKTKVQANIYIIQLRPSILHKKISNLQISIPNIVLTTHDQRPRWATKVHLRQNLRNNNYNKSPIWFPWDLLSTHLKTHCDLAMVILMLLWRRF